MSNWTPSVSQPAGPQFHLRPLCRLDPAGKRPDVGAGLAGRVLGDPRHLDRLLVMHDHGRGKNYVGVVELSSRCRRTGSVRRRRVVTVAGHGRGDRCSGSGRRAVVSATGAEAECADENGAGNGA
jgi:hypothetical protein